MTPADTSEFSDRQRAILDFERTWWTLDDSKDALIRERFQCSADNYYQELNAALEHSGAMSYDPLVVRRLRRLRDRRRRARLDGIPMSGTSGGEHA